jgi:hypothetical protein
MKILLIIIFFVLSGCATAYQRESLTGGYSQTQLGENIFQVSFLGNGYTSEERASDFTLLRSAEIALENGFKYFTVIDSNAKSELSTYTTPTTSRTTGYAQTYGNYTYGKTKTTTYGGETYVISKPKANNTILCFKEKPEINGIIFDATFVYKSIREKYNITE